MNILIATDLTSRSEWALQRALKLASEFNAKIRIVHVVDEKLPLELRAHSQQWAKDALDREVARKCAISPEQCEIDVAIGEPSSYIVRSLARSKFDLLVMGMHPGIGERSKRFRETMAGRTLTSSLVPTLLVASEPTETYRSVIVGVDFTAVTRAAIRQAIHIAPSGRIQLVHAYSIPFKSWLSSESDANEVSYNERLELEAFLKGEMSLLSRTLSKSGVPEGNMEKILKEGVPQSVIREMCKQRSADLVAIATHGRGSLSRAIWGSVAADLLEDPPTDVLVVKPY